jgi:hypothetical protein
MDWRNFVFDYLASRAGLETAVPDSETTVLDTDNRSGLWESWRKRSPTPEDDEAPRLKVGWRRRHVFTATLT